MNGADFAAEEDESCPHQVDEKTPLVASVAASCSRIKHSICWKKGFGSCCAQHVEKPHLVSRRRCAADIGAAISLGTSTPETFGNPPRVVNSGCTLCIQQRKRLKPCTQTSSNASLGRLLPAPPQETSVALRLKNIIEILYDDAVAAIESAEFNNERHATAEHTWLGSLDNGFKLEKPPTSSFNADSRTTTAASNRADEPASATSCSCGTSFCARSDEFPNQCGDTIGNVALDNPGIMLTQKMVTGSTVSEKGGMESSNDDCVSALPTVIKDYEPENVISIVRGDWGASTLLICSRYAVMRTLTSAAMHRANLNWVPTLCINLQTVTDGVIDSQYRLVGLGLPLKGFWRSSHVFLRIDRMRDGAVSPHRSMCISSQYGVSPVEGPFRVKFHTTPYLTTIKRKLQSGGLSISALLSPAVLNTDSCSGRTAVGMPRDGVSLGLKQWQRRRSGKHSREQSNDLAVVKPTMALREPVTDALRRADPGFSLMSGRSLVNHQRRLAIKEKAAESEKCLGHLSAYPVGGQDEQSESGNTRREFGSLVVVTRQLESRPSTASFCVDRLESLDHNGRRSRLASLLSCPCDTFEGFIPSGRHQKPAQGEILVLEGPKAELLPVPTALEDPDLDPSMPELLPVPVALEDPALGKKSELLQAQSALNCVSSNDTSTSYAIGASSLRPQKCGESSSKSSVSRGRQVSRGPTCRQKGWSVRSKAQVSSGNSLARGPRSTLQHCYSACARTIGAEALTDAQNSVLGMCAEERALAAVFLEFVTLVAPGATDVFGGAFSRGRRRKEVFSGATEEIPAATFHRTGGKRKQVKVAPAGFSALQEASHSTPSNCFHSVCTDQNEELRIGRRRTGFCSSKTAKTDKKDHFSRRQLLCSGSDEGVLDL